MGDFGAARLAVWKFASCDRCQLSLLDCADDFLALAYNVQIADFSEASSRHLPGPFDLSIVEGSISTPADFVRIKTIRDQSRLVLTIGACASSGGIQALRNFGRFPAFASAVYPQPEYIAALEQSTGVAEVIKVDYELRGCPVDKVQLMDTVRSLLVGRLPHVPAESVCVSCKMRAINCVAVSSGQPCMGPVTQGGCEALCPSYGRGCFGCYGPKEQANIKALLDDWTVDNKTSDIAAARLLHHIHAWSEPFKSAGSDLARDDRGCPDAP